MSPKHKQQEKTTPTCFILKLLKSSKKGKTVKAHRKKKDKSCTEERRMTANFFLERVQPREVVPLKY